MPRQTMDGARLEEHERTVPLVIQTRVPDKWLFVDRETGEVWQHDPQPWRVWQRYGRARVVGDCIVIEKTPTLQR